MSALSDFISESQDIFCGEGIENRKALIYKMEMRGRNMAVVSDEWVEFLKDCNGVRSENGRLFGANPVFPFEDIIKENEIMNMDCRSDIIILGYNEFDYLAYHQERKVYQFLDIFDFDVMGEEENWQKAICSLLKL